MPPSPPNVIHLHPRDNVAVAARALGKGEAFACAKNDLTAREAIPAGHKVAVAAVPRGAAVVKFGQYIGTAARDIAAGEWVHTHNVEIGAASREYEKSTAVPAAPEPLAGYAFNGYRRADGRVGTRNYLAIISNVNCSASVAKQVARRFARETLAQFPNVDGVVAFSHGNGCGMQHQGEFHRLLNRVMAGMARHPNIGGYLMIGLGCETATIGGILEAGKLVQLEGMKNSGATASQGATAGLSSSAKIQGATAGLPGSAQRNLPLILVMQDLGGTQNTIDAAVNKVAELLPRVNAARRESCPAGEIILGTNCGGSDGNSGITANAALGFASDLLVAAGGTTILAETTEIYGAEQVLTRRARTSAIADKLLERIRWWEWYSGMFGATPDNNPSPGNKLGGLTTIYEKSLGAIVKGGTTALNAVYEYAEQVTERGLVVMDTPGLDPVSVTGIVAGGANLVAFTTGRGSCFGFKPSPVLKIASNTPMYEKMVADMDLNAGGILDGRSVSDSGWEIFHKLLAMASGKKSKSEQLDLGDEEFQPWMLGPTL